jgi:hypothetical protein
VPHKNREVLTKSKRDGKIIVPEIGEEIKLLELSKNFSSEIIKI